MNPGRHRWTLRATTALTLAGFAALSWAATDARTAPEAQQRDEIAHTVQQGDTLEDLARTYLNAPAQWPLLQARNKVSNPRRLQPGTVVWIPVRLQPSETATVAFVQGQATLRPHGSSAPMPVVPGGRLEEGAVLQVGPDAFVAVKLADGTVVRVQARSELQLRQLRRRGRAGSLQSVLEMRSGAVESTIPPNGETARRFELRTPRAVTSVRGTRYSVMVNDAGQTVASVLDGSVAVQPRQGAAADGGGALLKPGQGMAIASDGTLGAPRPLLPAPDTGHLIAMPQEAGTVTIDLPALAGAAAYEAQVAYDADFTKVLRQGRFADSHLQWPTLDDGTYYLAVRALDDAGIPGLPGVSKFSLKTRPVPPLYQLPTPGTVLATGAGELRCTQVPGVSWYRIQVSADPEFAQPALDAQRLTDCHLSLASLPAGRYFWRTASQLPTPAPDEVDQGPFAQPQPFTIADRPGTVPLKALQAQDGDAAVRVHWPAQPGQRFRLQLAAAADPAFADVLHDAVLEAPEWAASHLAPGEYLVRIQVLDPTGLQGDFSQPRLIRVGSGVRSGGGLPVSTSDGQPVRRP
ncbi:MAG: FecR domain-containing protein [Acidovorax sp.]|uniref:FecR domain-containing protein n=1 Tax=Acidovorax sp. TaxID=1872122 RepID=UPI0025C2B46D|nr:FecR domain-containing protein [Acidovorax sp.]MCE1194657.1 FecR domain-containing protein [Acidovorax sp.]